MVKNKAMKLLEDRLPEVAASLAVARWETA